MPRPTAEPTNTRWTVDFDTVRRQKLFRNPPTDHSAYPRLTAAIRPHIDSFNAIFDKNRLLDAAVKDLGIRTFLEPEPKNAEPPPATGRPPVKRNRIHVRITETYIEKPYLPPTNKFAKERRIYPAECRERHGTYRGKLAAKLEYRINDGDWHETKCDLGYLPLMLRSKQCHLEKFSPAELAMHKEETEELGGYFIVNGNEKLIRMLVVGKRNYPMAIKRESYTNRGAGYTEFGIQIRCVRPDQTSQSNTIHYLNTGDVRFRFSWKKSEYMVPAMMLLKALVETSDKEIFEKLVGPAKSQGVKNTFVTERAELLLRSYKKYQLHGRAETRAHLGKRFKHVLDVPEDTSDFDAGTELLRKVILVHLGNVNVNESQDKDKFDLLIFMIRKLYSLVAGDCTVDNPDAVSSQEILLGGFLYGMILKEKLELWITSLGLSLKAWSEKKNPDMNFKRSEFPKEFTQIILKRTKNVIGGAMEYFLSTGNLVSQSGLDLQQTSGFTVMAEKINFSRFLSHFRMIHRGSFFAQLKTTTVRKLLPESWGFLCPVHTPDGSPCGLLNHLAHECKIMTDDLDVSRIREVVARLGMDSIGSASIDESVVVQLDGKVLGYCSPISASKIARTIRYLKVEGDEKVPLELEVGYVPKSNGGIYPGIYMFSQAARMVRPVQYIALDKQDYVGPFEQQFMSIACREHEIEEGESTHVEVDITNILSIFANQTPFSDHNQSPRNMYQCQMSKQSMGTYGTATRYRTDNKSYRLQTGQTPIVRPPLYNEYGLDNFPNGMNAVVAVISYTGYDMDDAMILNKSAHERGFGHGTIYKTKIVHIDENNKRAKSRTSAKQLFGFSPNDRVTDQMTKHVDRDGLPYIGTQISEGDVFCVSHAVDWDNALRNYVPNKQESKHIMHRWKESESAFVEEVRLIGAETGDMPAQAVSIKFRIPRSPVIGDKFSSRHGQKGVCSQKYQSTDMPFSESGIVPDIIINPHAFPSRMTIGMFVESLAGKAGALHGIAQDSTPWRFNEQSPAGDYFGEQLAAAGYNYHGNEAMYSGFTGKEFHADIYLGVVYYQRLRHMVNDKFQVRTTGPIVKVTGQPVKGRVRGGGIRIGEMERDALLAHGTAFLLQDRLLNCSDYTKSWICKQCGTFLSAQSAVVQGVKRGGNNRNASVVRCRKCAQRAGPENSKVEIWQDGNGIKFVGGENTTVVAVPGVLKFLDVELCAMGVRMKFHVEP